MVIDQGQIEALLTQAEGMAQEAATIATEPASPPAPPSIVADSPEVARLLKIQVPAIVRLASRRMSIATIQQLSLGKIIEFHKCVDEPLELLINNHPIGKGIAVKVGEQFGLHVTEIRDAATRIKSMGK